MKPNSLLLKITAFLFLFLISGLDSTNIFAESENNTQVNRATWEKITKNKDYTEHYKELKTREVKDRNFRWFSFGDGGWLRIVAYGAVIVILVFLLYLLLKYTTNFFEERVSKKKDDIDIEKIEENLHKADLPGLLELALSKKDYKLALRIQYLMIIQKLAQFKWIEWKKDKTNGTYVREMTHKPHGNTFRNVTHLFDKIWYGDTYISDELYHKLTPAFQNLMTDISNES